MAAGRVLVPVGVTSMKAGIVRLAAVQGVMTEDCKCCYFDHGQICICGKFKAPCGHGVECYDVCVHGESTDGKD